MLIFTRDGAGSWCFPAFALLCFAELTFLARRAHVLQQVCACSLLQGTVQSSTLLFGIPMCSSKTGVGVVYHTVLAVSCRALQASWPQLSPV